MGASEEVVVGWMEPPEKAQAAAVLSCAFLANPNCVAVLRGQGERGRRKLQTMFRLVRLEHPHARVLVARSGGRIVGVLNAIDWFHCRTSPLGRLRILPALLTVLGTSMARSLALQRLWASQDRPQPHSHVGPVGVLPSSQGCGVGKRMLERYCMLLDERKTASFLETEKPQNVRLYERFGFRVVAEGEALGVHNWFMWREAAP